MMRHKIVVALASAGLLAVFSMNVSAASVTASSVNGDVKAGKGRAAPTAVSQGATIRTGSLVETGRDGQLTASFDDKNSFTVMPESVVKLDVRNGVVLNLQQGRVKSKLQDWPSRRSYKVKSKAGTFKVQGTEFDTAYRLGPGGEFIGGTDVTTGEVSYTTPELVIPSLVANGGTSVTRTVGAESVLYEITANGNPLNILVAGRHKIGLPAGSTVKIAISKEHQERFIAVEVTQGTATVGTRTLTPADGAVFVMGTEVLPNGGADEFMDAIEDETRAYAQSQLPGLTDEQIAQLRAQQQAAANRIPEIVTGGGLLPVFHAPFVPDKPMGFTLSPSGNP